MYVQVLNGNLREDEHFEDLGIDGESKIKMALKEI